MLYSFRKPNKAPDNLNKNIPLICINCSNKVDWVTKEPIKTVNGLKIEETIYFYCPDCDLENKLEKKED